MHVQDLHLDNEVPKSRHEIDAIYDVIHMLVLLLTQRTWICKGRFV